MQLPQLSMFAVKLLVFIIVNVSLQRQESRIADEGGGGGGSKGAVSAWTVAVAALVSSETATTGTTATPLPRIRPPRVQLNKCCHYGEHLDANQSCVMGSSELWVPLIFLINRSSYFIPAGGKPKFITFAENVRPAMPVELSNQAAMNSSDDGALQSPQQGCTLDELELFTGSANLALFSNGSLYVRERGQLIEPQRYCVDHDAALVCFPRDKSTPPRIRIRKCCGLGGSYDASKKTCTFPAVNGGASDSAGTAIQLPLNESVHETIYGFPQCQDKMTAYAIAGDFDVTRLHAATGMLQLTHKNLSTADYCLEHLRDGDHATTVKVFTCLHHFVVDAPANTVATAGSVASDRLQVAVLNIGIVISVVFLAATLVAGYMMPSVHHVLHWRCQIYYVLCLFVGDLLLAYSQLSSALELGSAACLWVASAMHFFFLSAFFWLNTMCFNIWWTFRDFRPSSLERNQELLRLRLYSVYAWGVPLLISAIAVIVDHLPETQLLRPGFGVRSCWFSGEHLSIFAYFFGPVGLLLCANIMLFISTTHQLTCGLWKRDDVKSTTEKTALGKVCLKLVVVMGVTWIAEIISWLIGGPHSAWFITDLINALQGVFIFIVVGCQPQVWAACKRFCCPRSRQEITNTTNGVQHSSSSQGLPSMAACGGEITQNTSVTTTIGGNTTQAKIPMETVC